MTAAELLPDPAVASTRDDEEDDFWADDDEADEVDDDETTTRPTTRTPTTPATDADARGPTAADGLTWRPGRRLAARASAAAPDPPAARRRGRISPQALADARGGAVEGLAWLGRAAGDARPRSSTGSSACSPGSSCSALFRFRIADLGPGAPAGAAATCSSGRPIAAGWTRSSSSTPCPIEPRAWFLGSAPSTFTARWREVLIHRLGGLLPVWRGGIGVDQHVASARAVIANGGVFAQMPEGTVSGPAGRIGPFRLGWAVIALRTDAPIVPLAMAGTEELYVGRRMASRILPPTSVAGAARTGLGRRRPAEGTRAELDLARRLSEALAARARAGRRGAPAADRRSARITAPAPRRLTWLLLRPGPRSTATTRADEPPDRAARLSSAAMQYAESILDLVGDTPLVRLTRVTRDLGPADRQPLILAKLEMLNPGGSVKDRIGLPMIEAAERAGPAQAGRHDHRADVGQHRPRPRDRRRAQGLSLHLRHGRQAVGREAGAAAGLRRRGRPVPDERRARIAGVVLLGRGPARPRHPGRVQAGPVLEHGEPGRPRADDRPRDLGPDRGPDHPLRGERRDRRDDLRGRPLPQASRTRRSSIVGADPEGSVLSGDTARPYLTEGVGEDFFPGTYDPAVVDRWVRVSDRDAFAMARRLTREEGILAGESCGTALVAALDEVAPRADARPASGAGSVIVVLLPDGGRNYLSKLYNDEWMRVERPARRRPARSSASPSCCPAGTTSRSGRRSSSPGRRSGSATRSRRSRSTGSARCRSRRTPRATRVVGIVGSISEKGLLDRAYRDPTIVERTVGEVMDAPLPLVDASATLDEAFALLSRRRRPRSSRSAASSPAGVVTKLDLLEYLSHLSRG